ncbi:hypothetical protein M5K25_020396 [Dendrobium thyrsiflorum]|uniref:Homologous-pairing protein 2 homolog n=1 Tax=Dendrobium thyrsiflorum TaxID=117978 RepID=A0ABD0UGL3_DENTH
MDRGDRLYQSRGRPQREKEPLNSQNVADALQKYNLKKSAIQKALDTLADSGQISFKEYGKQKIYLARQDQFKIPSNQELDQMKKENCQLQEQIDVQKKARSEIEAESETYLLQVYEMEAKLKKLRDGVILVKPEEKKLIEQTFNEKMNHWRKRKRIFKDLWDAITENSPKDAKEFKEELGLEYDEDVGVSLQSYSELMNANKKRRTVQ